MNDQQKLARQKAYDAMMQSEAWKNLEQWAKDESEASMKRVDATSAENLNLGLVCEERGIRKGIFKVLQHAEFCREGH